MKIEVILLYFRFFSLSHTLLITRHRFCSEISNRTLYSNEIGFHFKKNIKNEKLELGEKQTQKTKAPTIDDVLD